MDNFKGDQGHWLKKALFYETMAPIQRDKGLIPFYTLKEHDHKGLPSLRALYLEEEDIEGYTFSKKYLGGWEHWQSLLKATWFQPHAVEWQIELEAKIRSRCLATILESISDMPAKDKLLAAKYILDGKWKTKEPPKKSKAEDKDDYFATEVKGHVSNLEAFRNKKNG